MEHMKPFHDKVVLVVGGTRGIGAAIVRRFASLGAGVAIGHRSADAAAGALVGELETGGTQARAFAGDVARPDATEAMIGAALDAFGRLDILVNAAGIGPYLPLEEIDAEHYRTIFDTNVLGTILMTKAAAPLLPAPGGRIVNLASRLAYSPLPTSSVYAASKAAVVTFTQAIAKELGPRGITVNAVAPGLIETDMTRSIIAERGEAVRSMTPLGRIGQPEDIAGIVTFLASPDAGWITGRTILADGGLL